MTLLVGVLCAGGAVIAADRQATLGGSGVRTVGQSVTKVSLISDNALFATSGHLGLGQQLAEVISRKHKEFANDRYHQAVVKVQQEMRKIIDPALNTARLAAGVVGPQVALQEAACGCLLAAHFKDGQKLVEITWQCSAEFLTRELSFVSIGSGKPGADLFLGFLRKVFWPEKPPSVREGVLAAYWTVKHAIEMKVEGVGFDVDVFVVEQSGSGTKARKLEDVDTTEHTEFIKAAEESLQALRDNLSKPAIPGAEPVAQPPKLQK